MRNHVLFNLLNKLGKRDKMRGLLFLETNVELKSTVLNHLNL